MSEGNTTPKVVSLSVPHLLPKKTREEVAREVAEGYYTVYKEMIRAGFSVDQAFSILMEMYFPQFGDPAFEDPKIP